MVTLKQQSAMVNEHGEQLNTQLIDLFYTFLVASYDNKIDKLNLTSETFTYHQIAYDGNVQVIERSVIYSEIGLRYRLKYADGVVEHHFVKGAKEIDAQAVLAIVLPDQFNVVEKQFKSWARMSLELLMWLEVIDMV